MAERLEKLREGIDHAHESVVAFNSPKGWLALFWATILSGPSHANKLLAGYVALRAVGLHANFVDILLVQTLVMFLLYFAPTPGASGIGEVLSAAVMSSYVPRELTPIYILIWRLTLSYFTIALGFLVFSGWVRRGLKGVDESAAGGAGRIVSLMDQDEALDKSYDARLLRRLLVYLRPYRGLTALAVLLLLVGAGLALVGPALTQRALDVAIPARDTGLLGTLALLFLAALVLEFAGRVRPDPADHLSRPAGDVRPANADLRPSPAPEHQLLRPESGRPADDPGHLRRRDPQRVVLVREWSPCSATCSPCSPS